VNPVDLGVVVVIALSALFAFARGFVREALSIIAWVGAALITIYGFGPVFALVAPLVPTPLLADLIAGLGLFIAGLVVLTVLTGLVARTVRLSALSPIDRTLGFIFGVVRGAVVLSLAYIVLDVTVQPSERPLWLRDAKSMPFLAEGADMLRGVLPESLRAKVTGAADDSRRALNQAQQAQQAMKALANPAPVPPRATAALPASPAAAPATPAPATPAPGAPARATAPPTYDATDRHGLDRLIESQH
jgi:membrane protein required for colicin V production